ncbi:CoA transferase [Pseudoclavibacter endophyticus]|uniref:CaiB/BaiF CoA transferase family protein n=1 Tax=Pseudoclavibacter endophyticus TaxID=1778590 RepID=UPI0016689E7C|nr:CoA transferase [Pseudoclavibacter endophyticus]GGA68722.1 CoA transferase [Pseudoclavibacter endophyticus]
MTDDIAGVQVQATGPLAGLKVLDLGVLIAGPLVGAYLGDLGADVVKVERPGGDPCRLTGTKVGDVSLIWKYIGRNKRTISLDFGDDDDRETLLALVDAADVIIENFRPGTLARHGLDLPTLSKRNPSAVCVSISGFGQHGDYAQRAGFGTVAESMVGFVNVNGWPDGPPTLPPVAMADSAAAMSATIAVLAALLKRESSATGDVIDVSLLEPLFTYLTPQFLDYQFTGMEPQRHGNRLEFAAPRGAYRCGDGKWFAISGATPAGARRIFSAIGRDDMNEDERYLTNTARVQHYDEIDDIIGAWAGERTRDEAIDALAATGAAVGPVYGMSDVLEDQHFAQRQVYVDLPDDDVGHLKLPNVFARFTNSPAAHRHAGRPENADATAIRNSWIGERSTEGTRQ